jgi:predicted enzyme related to lactoylglutathione lyase
VGFTVADMDRSVDFYSRVLQVQKTSDRIISGADVARLKAAHARVACMKLDNERIIFVTCGWPSDSY